MRYPTVEESKLAEVAPRLLENAPVVIATELSSVGTGEEMDPAPINDSWQCPNQLFGAKNRVLWLATGSKASSPESSTAASMKCHPKSSRIRAGGGCFQCDSGISWFGTEGAFQSGDYRNYRRYIDGKLISECVPSRMFLRAAIAKVGDDYSLASAVTGDQTSGEVTSYAYGLAQRQIHACLHSTTGSGSHDHRRTEAVRLKTQPIVAERRAELVLGG